MIIYFKDWVKVFVNYDIIEIQVHHLPPLPLVARLHHLHLHVPSTRLRPPPCPPLLLLHPCLPCPLHQPYPSCSSPRVQRPILCSHQVIIFLTPNFLICLNTSKMDVLLTASCCALVPTPVDSHVRAHNLLQVVFVKWRRSST